LIPNSLFISEKVKNWTLHNYSGRVQIKVGVHYTSNPRQVHDILLEVARADPNVMTNPEPFVYFGDFAADALEFTLYAYTYDITKSLRLRTELRMAIAEAFQREGIEIPYRQTDIHFRDEWFKTLLDRQNSQAPQAEPHAKYPAPIGRASARQKP
jgi:small-conductance mechanosensitive channel